MESSLNLRGEQGLDLSWPRREVIPFLGYHDLRFLDLKVDLCPLVLHRGKGACCMLV